jgi:hypothetical protein
MKARMELEASPFGSFKNVVKTESDFGVQGTPSIQSLIEIFINFTYQLGYDIDETKYVFDAVYENEIDGGGSEEIDTSEIVDKSVIDKLHNKHMDIDKIVKEKDNRQKFLEQLSNNEEMLKETFRLYLQDTLELFSDE